MWYVFDVKVINFINLVGVMIEVMQCCLGDQVVGICDFLVGLVCCIFIILQCVGLVLVDLGFLFDGDGCIYIGYSGFNYLGWFISLNVDGVDVLLCLFE